MAFIDGSFITHCLYKYSATHSSKRWTGGRAVCPGKYYSMVNSISATNNNLLAKNKRTAIALPLVFINITARKPLSYRLPRKKKKVAMLAFGANGIPIPIVSASLWDLCPQMDCVTPRTPTGGATNG
eukprot:scaffold19515_cov31-Tisochrysis_lutea.AAC.3